MAPARSNCAGVFFASRQPALENSHHPYTVIDHGGETARLSFIQKTYEPIGVFVFLVFPFDDAIGDVYDALTSQGVLIASANGMIAKLEAARFDGLEDLGDFGRMIDVIN
jgi:hypothetical protein